MVKKLKVHKLKLGKQKIFLTRISNKIFGLN